MKEEWTAAQSGPMPWQQEIKSLGWSYVVVLTHLSCLSLPKDPSRPGKPRRQTWVALRHSPAMLKMYAYFPKQAPIKESTSVLSPPFMKITVLPLHAYLLILKFFVAITQDNNHPYFWPL